MKINIIIPTYNRAYCLSQAVESALNQTYGDFNVTVIDDGSTDGTPELVKKWFRDPRFVYVRLSQNGGTARAKNIGIALSSHHDALTFHDSDDVASPSKILLQSRALGLRGNADDILDWSAIGHEPGSEVQIDVAVHAHKFLKLDGSVHIIDKRISLVDDFFPNLQSPSKTEGDWVLINSGLFRRRCFQRLGGYLDSVEEDREIRNRLIASGHLFHFISEPLLTKIEMEVSLTTNDDTGYRGGKRKTDRDEVFRRNKLYRSGAWGEAAIEIGRVPLELNDVSFTSIHNAEVLAVSDDLPMSEGSYQQIARELRKHQQEARVETDKVLLHPARRMA